MNKVAKKIFLGIGLCFLASVLGGYYWAVVTPTQKYHSNLAKLEKMGVPVSADSMLPKVKLADGENAALLIVSATKTGELANNLRAEIRAAQIAKSEQEFSKIAQSLSTFVQTMDNAAKLTKCSFNRDWNAGFNLEFPEYSFMKSYIQFCAARAKWAAKRGDFTEAETSIIRGSQFIRYAQEDPTLIGSLVGVAGTAILSNAVVNCWSENPSSPQAQLMVERFADSIPTFEMATPMRGEYFFQVWAAQQTMDGRSFSLAENESDDRLANALLSFNPIKLRATNKVLEFVLETYAITQEKTENLKYFEDKFLPISQRYDLENGLDSILLHSLLPVFEQAPIAMLRANAQPKLLRAALKIQREELQTLTNDPIFDDVLATGKLKFRREKHGFVLYSVGTDGVDHGGVLDKKITSPDEKDMSLQLIKGQGLFKYQ